MACHPSAAPYSPSLLSPVPRDNQPPVWPRWWPSARALTSIFLVITVMVLPSKESLTVLKHETLCLKFYVANNRENLAKLHNLGYRVFTAPFLRGTK